MPPITFTHPIHHGADPLHNHPPPPKRKPTPRPPGLNLGTLNIRDGRSSGLAMAIREFQQGNYDIVIATETKITDEVYTKHTLGYEVTCSKALPHQGGVALITRAQPEGWNIESTRFHGPNVLSCLIVSGTKRMPLVGVYLPPSSLDSLPDFEEALTRFQGYTNIVAAGDLNADITDLASPRNQQVAACLATHGLFDLLPHFRQRRSFRHNTTWYQIRQGTLYQSRCDYILGTDRRLFETVALRDPRSYSTDHLMLRGRLLRQPTKCHKKYLNGRKKFPLAMPPIGPYSQADTMYAELKASIHIPPRTPRSNPPQWMSANTLRLLDTRAALRRNKHHSRQQARVLTRQIKQSLKADWRKRAEDAAQAIGACLHSDTPDLQQAWNILKRWYRHATARQPKPSREDLTTITAEYTTLYTAETPSPPGHPIPVHVAPFPINDANPTDQEIGAAVQRLKSNKSPGASNIRAEHFKAWYIQAFPQGEDAVPDRTNWDRLVAIITHIWSTGEIPTELTWTILVLIPKDGGKATRGIGLTETLWKLIEAIIDTRVRQVILFHDILHGFISRRGTGTAILEAKLAQELASVDNEPLFVVFLDLKKAYDTIDRPRSLEIFRQYGMGNNMLRLLQSFWMNQKIVPRQSGFHGEPFDCSRGQTQGGLFSPLGFNIVMDASLREWLATVIDDNGNVATDGFGMTVEEKLALFYADDGYIGSRDDGWLNNALQVLADILRRVGLESNPIKTKTMTCLPVGTTTSLSNAAYTRRTTGEGPTYRERLSDEVQCPECGKSLARSSLPLHRRRQHGLEPPPTWNMANMNPPPSQLYTVKFPNNLVACPCPVQDCPFSTKTRAGLRYHFFHRHWHDKIHIVDEHPVIFPKCPKCDLHVPHLQFNNRHFNSDTCRNGATRKARRTAERRAYQANTITFQLNEVDLEKVAIFRYLGRLIASNNSDWPSIYHNLKKAQARWRMVSRVLIRDGASPAAMGMFYKAVVQAVLLYGCESWTLTTPMIKTLEAFHHRVARRISKMTPTRHPDGTWTYPPLQDALEAAGLFPLREYIHRRVNTIRRYIEERPIYQLCLISSAAARDDRCLRWWTQSVAPSTEEELDSDHEPQAGDA